MPFRYLFPAGNADEKARASILAAAPGAILTSDGTVLEVVVSDEEHELLDFRLPVAPVEFGPVDELASHLTVAVKVETLQRLAAASETGTKQDVDAVVAELPDVKAEAVAVDADAEVVARR